MSVWWLKQLKQFPSKHEQRPMINKCQFITGMRRIGSFVVWTFNQLPESMRHNILCLFGSKFNLALMVSARITVSIYSESIQNCRTEFFFVTQIFRAFHKTQIIRLFYGALTAVKEDWFDLFLLNSQYNRHTHTHIHKPVQHLKRNENVFLLWCPNILSHSIKLNGSILFGTVFQSSNSL